MLCRSTTCRLRNEPATRHLRWRYKADPPGTRPMPVSEARYCDPCAEAIRTHHAELVLLDEPIEQRPLDVDELHRMAVRADDDQLTYEALTGCGLDRDDARFVSELVMAWQAILDRLNGGHTNRLEVLRQEVASMHLHFGRNSLGVPVVMGGEVVGAVSGLPEVVDVMVKLNHAMPLEPSDGSRATS